MIIEFKSKKLKKECEDFKKSQKKFGKTTAKKLAQRIFELQAATSLLDIKSIPAARLHRLKSSRSNEFALDLKHPFRLVIKPIVDRNFDLNDLKSIKIVRIEEVTDYHGK